MQKLTKEQCDTLFSDIYLKCQSIPNPQPLLRDMLTFVEINDLRRILIENTDHEEGGSNATIN